MNKEEESLPEPAAGTEYRMVSLGGRRKQQKFPKEVIPPLPTQWSGEDPECISPQPHLAGQDTVTHPTRSSLLQRAEEARKQKLRHEYYMHQFRVTTYAVLLSVQKIHKKPKELDSDLHPLKWQRLKDLMKSLNSSIILERKDAVKALKCLNCTNKEVVSALYNTLQTEEDCAVRCEAAKALVTLGYWDEGVVLKLVEMLTWSRGPALEDIVVTLRKSLRDLALKLGHQQVEPTAEEALTAVLTALMTTPRSKDTVPVQAAACLCYLNSGNQKAIEYIMSYLHDGDTYQKKQALEVVLRYLGIHETFPIQVLLEQIQTSPIYKHRLKALDLLVAIGTPHITMAEMYQAVLEMLKRKLWEDPVLAVSRRAVLIVNILGMKRTVWEDVEKQLEEDEALSRAQAVISLSILGLPRRRVLQTLLEMLETDPSQYVRFQIIRAFAQLHLKDARVKQSLLNRQLGKGPLAREAHKAMKILEKASVHRKTMPHP